MTAPDGQVHRSREEWNDIARGFKFKSLADLLQTWYHKKRMSSEQIAMKLTNEGHPVTALRVRQLMRRLKIKRRPLGTMYPSEFWNDVDWKKSDQQIADEKAVDPATVRRWRRKRDGSGRDQSGGGS